MLFSTFFSVTQPVPWSADEFMFPVLPDDPLLMIDVEDDFEDDILVTDSGHEVLSNLPKGLDDCRFIL